MPTLDVEMRSRCASFTDELVQLVRRSAIGAVRDALWTGQVPVASADRALTGHSRYGATPDLVPLGSLQPPAANWSPTQPPPLA